MPYLSRSSGRRKPFLSALLGDGAGPAPIPAIRWHHSDADTRALIAIGLSPETSCGLAASGLGGRILADCPAIRCGL